MKVIDGGVTAAKGFEAAGAEAAIKYQNRKDMAMVYSKVPCKAAGTFTTNVVKAAPVLWDRDIVANSEYAQAVVVNAGIANACTGKQGLDYCRREAEVTGRLLGIPAEAVLVGSTGVIGMQLPMDRIAAGVEKLAAAKDGSEKEGLEAAMLDYAPLVKAVLNRILPQNPCDREECMADVFVSLWRNAAKLERTATPLRPWLIVTARNKGIDRYNALRRREVLSLDDGLAETLGELAEFDRATADAADLVGALVAAMEPPDRDIFLRKYYLLQSGKEIAAALNMSVESINTRLSRGRDRLRRQLTEKGVYTHA